MCIQTIQMKKLFAKIHLLFSKQKKRIRRISIYARRHHPIPRVSISTQSQMATLYARSKTSRLASVRTICTILRAYTPPGFNEGWSGSELYPKGTAGIQEIQDRRSPDAEQSPRAYGSKLLSPTASTPSPHPEKAFAKSLASSCISHIRASQLKLKIRNTIRQKYLRRP